MPSYAQLLEQAQALSASREALKDYLWRSERVFTDALAARLDELAPAWRELMGPLLPLLWMGRAGEVEPWLKLEELTLEALTLPQRQRLWRALKHPTHLEAIAKLLTPQQLDRCIHELYAQWVAAQRPKPSRWLQGLYISQGGAQARATLEGQLWQKDHSPHQRLELLDALLSTQELRAHQLAQRVAYEHPLPTLRAAAQAYNQRCADAAKLGLMAWADKVAALPHEPEELERLTRKRLEVALRQRQSWSLSELREVVCSKHPLAATLRALLWVNERGQRCSVDERGQPRDLHGEAIAARELTLAHPIDMDERELERWRARHQGLMAPPIAQLERMVFTATTLIEHEDAWARPSWPERLRPFTILSQLRDDGQWELTEPEDNGWIAGLYRYDARTDRTVLVRLMDSQDQARYGHAFYSGTYANAPDYPISWGLILLKGRWDKQRLGGSYRWPPHFTPYGLPRAAIIAPQDVDALFLSEVLRELYMASR